MLIFGCGLMAMAAYDFFVATYAVKNGGLFSRSLWKIQQIFGPSASAFAILGLSLIFFLVAFNESKKET